MYTIADAILHNSHIAALISCFVFNIILIICLYTEQRPQLRLYSNVLFAQCCSDMVAGVLYYFGAARFLLVDEIFYFVPINPLLEPDYVNIWGYSLPTNCIGLCLHLSALGLPITFLPLNYYYRYLQLSR